MRGKLEIFKIREIEEHELGNGPRIFFVWHDRSKFYIIGYSMGGQGVWGCLKYIPNRWESNAGHLNCSLNSISNITCKWAICCFKNSTSVSIWRLEHREVSFFCCCLFCYNLWDVSRIAGATLLAPVINYWWPGFPANLSTEAYYQQLPQDRSMGAACCSPSSILGLLVEHSKTFPCIRCSSP